MSSPAAPQTRFSGVDAARGLALFGMMAVHVLPETTSDGSASWVPVIFAGKSAALFALLAGVSLAFTTRRARSERGVYLTAARWSVATRAVLVMAIGLTIAYVDMPAFIILAYYGAMFALAVPLLGLSTRALLLAAAGFALLGPVLMEGLRDFLPPPGFDPTFTTLLTEPGVFASQLLLTGTYPALPWMAYICAGLALGRLRLDRPAIQWMLLGSGTALAAGSWLASQLLLYGPSGGFTSLLASEPGLTSGELQDMMLYGSADYLPTSSWWWLALAAPHSSTPVDLLFTLGVAAAVIGAMLLLARYAGKALLLLSAPGRMTLTLYSTHLLFLGTGILADQPYVSFVLQCAVFIAFAVVIRRAERQGPLEKLVSDSARKVRDTVLRRSNRAVAQR